VGRAVGDPKNQLIWHGIAFAITAGVSIVALACLFLTLRGKRWLPLVRQRPASWAGWQVLLALLVFWTSKGVVPLLQAAGVYTLLIGPPPDIKATPTEAMPYQMRCLSIGSPLILAITLGLLYLIKRFPASRPKRRCGLTGARWQANLAAGLATFVLAWPIIMGIHTLAALAFPVANDPYLALGGLGLAPWEWALFVFQTVIAAPLVEEIVFRGILLGWLRRTALIGHVTIALGTLYVVGHELATFNFGPPVFAAILTAAYGYGIFHMKSPLGRSECPVGGFRHRDAVRRGAFLAGPRCLIPHGPRPRLAQRPHAEPGRPDHLSCDVQSDVVCRAVRAVCLQLTLVRTCER
jgi:membrane protease YdiL (CAAX protease family)